MADRYKLVRDYERPVGTIKKGVIKASEDWFNIFEYINGHDLNTMTDWFQKIEEKPNDNRWRYDLMEDAMLLISSIFYHGDFKIETKNEAELAKILTGLGYRFMKEQEPIQDVKYTEVDLRQARIDAFNAGKIPYFDIMNSYGGFRDAEHYLQSLNTNNKEQ